MISLADGGAGLALLPDFLVQQEVEEARLARLTRPSQAAEARVLAVTDEATPHPCVIRLLEHLVEGLHAGEEQA